MENNAFFNQLHDRETRGEILTSTEQAQLTAWYETQDEDETALLVSSMPVTSPAIDTLRHEVEEATGRLLTVTQRLHSLTEENEALHRDIAALSERLTQTTTPFIANSASKERL